MRISNDMAILSTQRVLTLDYWKLAKDINPGDIVFDRLGNPVKVKLVQDFNSSQCYRVHFNDGTAVEGDNNLKLLIETSLYRTRTYTYKGVRKFKRPLANRSVQELAKDSLLDNRKRKKYSVPTTGGIKFPTQPLPVPPFLFGFWLFNKRADHTMKPPPVYMEFLEKKFRDSGYKLTWRHDSMKHHRVYFSVPNIVSHLVPNIPNKIPDNYLFASAEQRQELLSGILHSKGRLYQQKNKEFRFTSVNYQQIRQIQNLAESLGCKTRIEKHRNLKNYSLRIKTKLKLMEDQEPDKIRVHQNRRYISEIEKIKPQACVFIETDGPDKSFLVEEGFIACL